MKPRYFKSQADFRRWLEAHHATDRELVVGFHRKGSGKSGIAYKEAVDEALCFGWIDGIKKRVDESSYTHRFTPRQASSTWSAVNIKRVGELEKLGLMRAAGRKAFAARDEERSRIYSYENRHRGLDPTLLAAFKEHPEAWEFYSTQPPWYRNTAAYWVSSAKREETRARRFEKLIQHSTKRERIPPLARP